MGRRDKHNKQSQKSPSEAALEEAQTLQQRAERRRGTEATHLYSQSVSKFQEALQLGLPVDLQPDAHFGHSESLQEWAQQVLAIEGKLPDAQQSLAVAREASDAARGLLERAVQALQQMHQAAGQVWDRADGPVNCGNVLSELAELQAAQECIPTLQQAVQCYESALALEKDAVTYTNMGDALIQLAQAQHDLGDHAASQQSVAAAQSTYIQASSFSSSEDGDDLPGLLCNWGTGLLAASKMQQGAGGDSDAGRALAREAIERLEASVAFNKQDIEVVTLLGEAGVAYAEMLDPQAAVPVLEKAMADGFEVALRIDSKNCETLASKAEAHLASAHVATSLGAADDARRQIELSVDSFAKALAAPEKLGSFSDRCSLRHTYACALSLSGRLEQAGHLLQALLSVDPALMSDMLTDDDLQSVRATPFFQKLVTNTSVKY